MTDKIDLSNPNGTVFGLMQKEWQDALRKHFSDGGKVEFFADDWLPEDARPRHSSIAYRAAPEPLIPDSIDWSHVADNFMCMARDADGNIFLFEDQPETGEKMWCSDKETIEARHFKSLKIGTVPWGQSLVWRPAYEEHKQ